MASALDEAKLIRSACEGNDSKPGWVLQKGKKTVMEILSAEPSRSMSDIKVACLGLAFKPGIDDLRESPALQITLGFGKLGCQVLAVEPHITELPTKLSGGTITLTPLEEALAQADVICVLVKHSVFADLKDTLAGSARLIDVVGL